MEKLIGQEYVPSQVERRKAVMMYFFIWIIIGLIKGLKSDYEKYHFKQALGWWSLFFVVLVLNVVLLFVPILWLLWWIVSFLMIGVLVFFVYQAVEGKYVVDKDKIVLPFFYGIWEWIYNLFEIEESKDLKN